MHAGWNAMVKAGTDRFAAILQLALTQSTVALLLAPFFPAPAREAWPWLAAAGVLHTGYKVFLLRAYAHGDLSQVYPLARGTAPVLVALAGTLLLGETLGATDALAVAAVAAGVICTALFAGRGVRRIASKALAYALGTAGFTAAYTLADAHGARLAGTASGFALWLFVVDGLGMTAFGVAARGPGVLRTLAPGWRAGALAGVLSLASYWIAIWAFTRAPVALVAALRETSVLFAVLIAALILRERVGPGRWAAAALICAGVALMRF